MVCESEIYCRDKIFFISFFSVICLCTVACRSAQQASNIDTELKSKLAAFNNVKTNLATYERKRRSVCHTGCNICCKETPCFAYDIIDTYICVFQIRDSAVNSANLHLTTSKVMVILWRLRGNIFRTVLYIANVLPLQSSMGTVNKNSSYSPVGP